MYVKLFTHILDSSVWRESHATRIVWITLLVAKDGNGFARFPTVEQLATRAVVSVEEASKAVEILSSPDPNSANPANEGRRIQRTHGGYIILNADEYNAISSAEDLRERNREYSRQYRERQKSDVRSDASDSSDSVRSDSSEKKREKSREYSRKYRENKKLQEHDPSRQIPSDSNLTPISISTSTSRVKEGVETIRVSQPASELPTEEEAFAMTMSANIPRDFVQYVYENWFCRRGCDKEGCPVDWLPYVIKRWRKEQPDWKKKVHFGNSDQSTRTGNGKAQDRPMSIAERDLIETTARLKREIAQGRI